MNSLQFFAPIQDTFISWLGFFKEEGFAALAAVSILGLGFMLIGLYRYLLGNKIRSIRRATKSVLRTKGKEDFCEKFAEIDAEVSRTVAIKHAWKEFTETLVHPLENDLPGFANQQIKNTARPQNYLNAHETGLSFPFFKILPNMFVGLGLLVTFLGIVEAILDNKQRLDLMVCNLLDARRERYQLHDRKLPENFAISYPKWIIVFFKNGYFWHGHDRHLHKLPLTRITLWKEKTGLNAVLGRVVSWLCIDVCSTSIRGTA
ncbi:hypothetical protein ACTL6U_17120 [Rhodovibrionaceae bacterium A322]